MIVDNYISNHIIPLKLDDNFSLSARLMDEGKLSYFPVLNGNTYCGLISDLDIYELENLGVKIVDRRDLLKDLYIYNSQTLFEATSIILDNSLDILPVVDKNKKYLGVLTVNKLLEAYSTYTAANQQGDVIQIVLNYNDLYISEISRIIENEDARIINLFLVPISESTLFAGAMRYNRLTFRIRFCTLDPRHFCIASVWNASICQNPSKKSANARLPIAPNCKRF